MTEIAKSYDPGKVESKWYQRWLDRGAFKGRVEPGREPYSIAIPPPNVTGMLTMGHVLVNTLQDVFIRRARQEGKSAVWVPGLDHASIATHAKIEQALKAEGTSRREIGREAFLKRAWEWSDKHGGIILEQLRKLGASCDWERKVFTMDDGYQRAVLHAFVEFYRRGYIYRGKRMVNWCPASLTALSNEEVIMKPRKGFLYRVKYEVAEAPGTFVEISTTRPETIMGDTGVAVHPEDDRYRHLVGKHAWRPFPREEIPILADEAVDREFGTGVLKVTPAHDALDFEIGRRHGLPVVDVFNPDATLNALAGEDFLGLDRFEAREVAVRKLRDLGLLVKEEPYENKVGYSERADVPIEPRLSDQWWLRYPKVEEAKRAVEEGIIKLHPKRWEKVYLHWLNNIQDWCISRQLWWGQRIPVWYKKGSERGDPANWHVSVEGPEDPENWDREEDVLDTWASSNLWPFAVFGWPEAEEARKRDLEAFYPTSLLVTGFDILFFWVARMIMSGLELVGEAKDSLSEEEIRRRIPFRNVMIHGLLRDSKGRKLSKSLGNSPDPLDIIDRYGADGVRFGILTITPSGQDILFSSERLEVGRNFCNKLWNACRFRQMSGGMEDNRSLELVLGRLDVDRFDDFDHWILIRLLEAMKGMEREFSRFDPQKTTHLLHNFFWGDFCDWYLEAAKRKLHEPASREQCRHVTDFVLREVLLMAHPLIPFITEELWSDLGYGAGSDFIEETRIDTCAGLAGRVRPNSKSAEGIEKLKEFCVKGRGLKAEYGLGNRRDVSFSCFGEADDALLMERNAGVLQHLLGAASLARVKQSPANAPAVVTELGTLFLDLSSAANKEVERAGLEKELLKLEKMIRGGEDRLGNEKFLAMAPPSVVEGAREQLAANHAKREEIERLLAVFQ